MKSSYKLVLVLAIFAIIVITGIMAVRQEEVTQAIVFDPYITVYEPIHLFQELQEPHRAEPEGLEIYLITLRKYRAGLIPFADLLSTLQDVLSNYGLVRPFMEPGMFSIYDSGPMSRFQIITQHNVGMTEAFVMVIDLGNGPAFVVTPIFQGAVHFLEICQDLNTVIITLLDGTEYSLYWRDIGVS